MYTFSSNGCSNFIYCKGNPWILVYFNDSITFIIANVCLQMFVGIEILILFLLKT